MLVKTLSSQFLAARRDAAVAEFERQTKQAVWDARNQVMIYEGNLITETMRPPSDTSLMKFWYEKLDKLRADLEKLKTKYSDAMLACEGNIFKTNRFRDFLYKYEREHLPQEKDYVEVEVSDKSVPRHTSAVAPVEMELEVTSVVEPAVEEAPSHIEPESKPEVNMEESVMEVPTNSVQEVSVEADLSSTPKDEQASLPEATDA